MARDPHRLEKQKLRQRAYRARQKASRRPSNEDLARALLDLTLTTYLRQGRHEELIGILDRVARRLKPIGFGQRQTEDVWFELQDRYEKGWSLLRQRVSQADLIESGLVNDPDA